jgi:HAD superfamily hydrolase (TIGR01662 family)
VCPTLNTVIKGVFFDWFNTLAHYQTPREDLYRKAFRGAGLDIQPAAIYQGLQVGDRHYFSKQNLSKNPGNTLPEKARFYHLYAQAILTAAGAELPYEKQVSIIEQVLGSFSTTFVLYEDVLPLLVDLKQQGKMIGIITNADLRVSQIIHGLINKDILDTVVTSEEARSEKPQPQIFNTALNKLSLKASESIYVGDQYQSDIVGANGVGMKAILVDRFDALQDGKDYIRVKSLQEVLQHI